MFRLNRRWIGLILVATFVVAALSWVQHHQRYKHFAIHEPGMVYRSAWLEPDALKVLIERYQIRTIVNLCRPGEMGEQRWSDERRAVSNAGARLIELPMPTSINADDRAVAEHITVMQNPDNYPMLVHCQHGVTRTAKHLAIYDIVFRGMTGEQSLGAQPLMGRDRHNVHVRAFVNNFENEYRKLYPTASADDLRVLSQ